MEGEEEVLGGLEEKEGSCDKEREEESDESEASESESEKDSGGLPGFGVLITLASFTMALLFIGLRNADE